MQATATATALAAPALADSAPMRAVLQSRYGSFDVLRVGSSARPRPSDDEVIVRVHAAGVARGDWHMMTGRPYLMRVMGFGFAAPKSPVLGLDVAGTVVEVGPKVTRFAVGEEVFGIARGAFAEYAAAREDKLVRKPAAVSFEDAAVSAVSGITALQALRDAGRLVPGQRVLVVGASGGVGAFAVQLAHAMGAEVDGVCSASKMELVRGLGAHEVFDYANADFSDGTRHWDLVLDVGGNNPLVRLRRAMTPSGRLVFVGGENGGDWTAGFGRPLSAVLLGLFVKRRFAMHATREVAEDIERIAAYLASGAVKPPIDRRIGLDDVSDALRDLEAGRVRGKIVVVVTESAAFPPR
jgi:NADPH:quinone reductase-like Zn-dependent oxidoreductase